MLLFLWHMYMHFCWGYIKSRTTDLGLGIKSTITSNQKLWWVLTSAKWVFISFYSPAIPSICNSVPFLLCLVNFYLPEDFSLNIIASGRLFLSNSSVIYCLITTSPSFICCNCFYNVKLIVLSLKNTGSLGCHVWSLLCIRDHTCAFIPKPRAEPGT